MGAAARAGLRHRGMADRQPRDPAAPGSGRAGPAGGRLTAAFVFLASWFPFNNGLRPEPIICLGVMLTWCSVERAIATGRLLPAALACLFGAFSVAAGPTGLLAVAALIAGARPMITALVKRARVITDLTTDTDRAPRTNRPGIPKPADLWSSAALIAPILAAGTFVLFVVFSDLTLRSFTDSSSMKPTWVRRCTGTTRSAGTPHCSHILPTAPWPGGSRYWRCCWAWWYRHRC